MTASTVRLRAGRGTNHRTIRRFSRGTRLTILRSSRGWLQVRYGSFTGWVNARDVATQGHGRTTGRINLRRGPGTNHRRIRRLSTNTNVIVLQQRAGWARVQAGREIGWIRTSHLRISGVRTGRRRTRVQTTLHRGPGTSHRRIHTISSGATVRIVSQRGDWVRVRHNGRVGYVRARSIRR